MRSMVLLLIIVLAVALAGCSSEEVSLESPTPSGEEAVAAKDENVAAGEKAPAMGVADELQEELLKNFEMKSNAQYKIVYDITSTTKEGSVKTTSTEYVKGASKIRTDVEFEGIESRTYMINEVYTTCTKYTSSWTCNKFSPSDEEPSEGNIEYTEVEDSFTEEPDEFTLSKDGTMTVAGESTTCYKMSSKTNPAVSKWCFTKEGVPLYMKTEDTVEGFSSELKATSFSRSVSDADFELPAGAEVSEGDDWGMGDGAQDPDCVAACSEMEDTGAMIECLQGC